MPRCKSPQQRLTLRVIKGLVVASLIITPLATARTGFFQYGDGREKPQYYGLYEVSKFVLDGEERPPLVTDTERWRYLVVEQESVALVKSMSGETRYLSFKPDEAKGTIRIRPYRAKERPKAWTVDASDPNRLLLAGELEEKQYSMTLERRERSDFLLMNRGFHWISEVPYNR